MRTYPECVECLFRQALRALKSTGAGNDLKIKTLKRIAERLKEFDFKNPPIVMGRILYKEVSKATKNRDPFREEKRELTEFSLKFYKILRSSLKKTTDSLRFSLKLSALGNSFDFGTGFEPDFNDFIRRTRTEKFKHSDFEEFLRRLKSTKIILLITDNTGEIVFDRLLLENIKLLYPGIKIFIALRKSPIINDATLKEALLSGLDKVGVCFDSGCDYPGIILNKTNRLFKKILKEADLIISKGQGNFEGFFEEAPPFKTFFLFQVKCIPVFLELGYEPRSLIFLQKK